MRLKNIVATWILFTARQWVPREVYLSLHQELTMHSRSFSYRFRLEPCARCAHGVAWHMGTEVPGRGRSVPGPGGHARPLRITDSARAATSIARFIQSFRLRPPGIIVRTVRSALIRIARPGQLPLTRDRLRNCLWTTGRGWRIMSTRTRRSVLEKVSVAC